MVPVVSVNGIPGSREPCTSPVVAGTVRVPNEPGPGAIDAPARDAPVMPDAVKNRGPDAAALVQNLAAEQKTVELPSPRPTVCDCTTFPMDSGVIPTPSLTLFIVVTGQPPRAFDSNCSKNPTPSVRGGLPLRLNLLPGYMVESAGFQVVLPTDGPRSHVELTLEPSAAQALTPARPWK